MKAPTTFWTQNQMIFLGSTPVQTPQPRLYFVVALLMKEGKVLTQESFHTE